MEIFRTAGGAYGTYHFGRHAWEKILANKEQDALMDKMAAEVWNEVRPGVEMTDEGLAELRSMIMTRGYDYVNQAEYEKIDQALVDLGYADSTETAASENAFDAAQETKDELFFGTMGDVALAAFFAVFIAYIGIRQRMQDPFDW